MVKSSIPVIFYVLADRVHFPGFAVVGDYSEPMIMEAQQQAFGQMLSWLKAH